MGQQKNPRQVALAGVYEKSGDNLLSRYSHYHRPWLLNGRVRNGNGCIQPGMVTGKTLGLVEGRPGYPGAPSLDPPIHVYQLAAIRVALCTNPSFKAGRGGMSTVGCLCRDGDITAGASRLAL
jgi:hypothetical protein